MKTLKIIGLFIAATILFSSCDEDKTVQKDKIDKTTEDVKNLIDVLSGAAKEIVEDEDGKLEELKAKLKDLGEQSKEVGAVLEDEGEDLVKIIEKFKDDPKIKAAVEKLGANAEDLVKDLEEALKDIEVNIEEKQK